MIPEPKTVPVESKRGWKRLFSSTTDSDREQVLTVTNARQAHHLAHVQTGDTVILCGWVKAVTFPSARDRVADRARLTLDDGTGIVELDVSAEDGFEFLGKIVEVTGVLQRQLGESRWLMDAVFVEIVDRG